MVPGSASPLRPLFTFEKIPEGKYKLEVYKKDYVDFAYTPPMEWFDLSGSLDLGILKITPARIVKGQIYVEGKKESGGFLSGIGYKKEDMPYARAFQFHVKKDGSFEIDKVTEGSYYLILTDKKKQIEGNPFSRYYYPGIFSVAETIPVDITGSNTIEFNLKRDEGTVLKGRVTDRKTGEPIPQTLVLVNSRHFLFDGVTTYTDDGGYFSLPGLGAGKYQVQVDGTHKGYVRYRMPLDIEEDEDPAPLDLTLAPGVIIKGNFIGKEDHSNLYSTVWLDTYMRKHDQHSYSGARNKYLSSKYNYQGEYTYFVEGTGDYKEEKVHLTGDTSFMISALPPGNLKNFSFYPEKLYSVKEILYNGKDIQFEGLELEEEKQIEGITISFY